MKSLVILLLFLCSFPSFLLQSINDLGKMNLCRRYCALRNREAPEDCLRKKGDIKLLEIFEDCFSSMHGRNFTFDEKKDSFCHLPQEEYEAIKLCFENGLMLQHKRDGKILKITEECLFREEIVEWKAAPFVL